MITVLCWSLPPLLLSSRPITRFVHKPSSMRLWWNSSSPMGLIRSTSLRSPPALPRPQNKVGRLPVDSFYRRTGHPSSSPLHSDGLLQHLLLFVLNPRCQIMTHWSVRRFPHYRIPSRTIDPLSYHNSKTCLTTIAIASITIEL